jgi:hypothetical protein
MSESFHVKMSSSGSVVLEKKIFKCPTHFSDYLPVEEDLALNLCNFEFPILNENLYQVEIGQLVPEKIF